MSTDRPYRDWSPTRLRDDRAQADQDQRDAEIGQRRLPPNRRTANDEEFRELKWAISTSQKIKDDIDKESAYREIDAREKTVTNSDSLQKSIDGKLARYFGSRKVDQQPTAVLDKVQLTWRENGATFIGIYTPAPELEVWIEVAQDARGATVIDEKSYLPANTNGEISKAWAVRVKR